MSLVLLAPSLGWNLVLFLLGISLGSFFSVVVQRSLVKKNWISGRSCCDRCGQVIAWYDNVPLLSFLLLRGRCRYCHCQIPLFHPVIELLTGIGFVVVNWVVLSAFPPASLIQVLALFFWLLIFAISWLVFWFDWQAMIIPDSLVGLLGLLASFRLGWLYQNNLISPAQILTTLVATASLVGFFLSLWLLTKRQGFGLGDVKLAGPVGLLLGFPQLLVGVFSAFILGAVWGIILLMSGRKKLGQVVPFGPFLVIGLWLGLVWGQELWLVYWQLLN